MKSFVLLLVYFGIFFHGYAQKEFKKIFDKELEEQNSKYNQRESHSGRYQYIRPQQVPNWLIHPPVTDQNEIFAIGISDPEMDSVQGFELALYRARIMANVLHFSTTQLLCDFFVNEMDHSNSVAYEHFTRISAKIPKDGGEYTLVEKYQNDFEETMVLIKYTSFKKYKKNQFDNIQMELYKNETESNVHGEYESIYELQVFPPNQKDSVNAFYQLTELGTRTDVVSQTGNEIQQVPIYSLKYTGIPTSDSLPTTYLTHGLWKDLFKSTVLQIVSKAREKPENVSYLSDDYQKESYQKLTRGISVNRQRFVYKTLSKTETGLSVELMELDIP